MSTSTYAPVHAGDRTSLLFSGAGSNWQTQLTNDGNASIVGCAQQTAGFSFDDYDLYQLTSDLTYNVFIQSVQVIATGAAQADTNSGGVVKIGPVIKTGGTVYFGTLLDVTSHLNNYVDAPYTWTYNPKTGFNWTIADIAALQFGPRVTADAGVSGNANVACTQTQVIVTYFVPSSIGQPIVMQQLLLG